MSTSPVPSSILSPFLSVSNTGRRGRLGTWYQACMTPMSIQWNPSSHPTAVYADGVTTVVVRSSDEYFPPFFFFLSTCYPTLFLCLGHSCSMCLSKRPRQAEAPARCGRQRWGSRGAETVGAVFQAQSRYSSWGSEGPQCRGASWSPGQHDAAPWLC